MKYLQSTAAIFIALCFIFLLSPACEEVPPYIDFSEPDTTSVDTSNGNAGFLLIYKDSTAMLSNVPAAQEKVVMLEDFSGVRCNNCPDGHAKSEEIIAANPHRISTMVIHSGFFAVPYTESEQSFSTTEGENIATLVNVLGWPSAAIDRILFDGENGIAIPNINVWSAKVNQQLAVPTPVNMYVYSEYDEASRLLDVYVQLQYNTTETMPNQVTVALTESHIIDPQLMPDNSVNITYEHNHIMRTLLTPPLGLAVDAPDQAAGRLWVKHFSMTLPSDWVVENCEIVGFVHHTSGDSKQVLQSSHAYIIE